jgi:hypothetical protein
VLGCRGHSETEFDYVKGRGSVSSSPHFLGEPAKIMRILDRMPVTAEASQNYPVFSIPSVTLPRKPPTYIRHLTKLGGTLSALFERA